MKNRTTIYRYENNDIENLPITILEPLAKILKTTPIELLGWDEQHDSFFRLPIVKTIKVELDGIVEYDFQGYETVSEIYHPENYRAFLVKDNSMYPQIIAGDVAIVHIQDEIESGEIAVVIVNGEDGIVRVIHKQYNVIALSSMNPEFPTRVFIEDEMNKVKIWGKIVKIIRSFQ